MFSGVTDCYQPLEATYRLTRACLEVCHALRQPVGIITKSPLVERDIDVLQALASRADVTVTVSIPFWDAGRARAIEPYVATPQRRMRTIERLASAGLDVGVNLAPIIPGLNDEEIPDLLSAAKSAGARRAGAVLLRLPGQSLPSSRSGSATPCRCARSASCGGSARRAVATSTTPRGACEGEDKARTPRQSSPSSRRRRRGSGSGRETRRPLPPRRASPSRRERTTHRGLPDSSSSSSDRAVTPPGQPSGATPST